MTRSGRFLSDAARAEVAGRLEGTLREGMKQASTASLKSAYFGAFRRTVTTPEGLAYLERVWRRQESIPGLTFAETDYIDMAQELALRHVARTDAILTEQHASITNSDRKARFAFVMPALSPDAAKRDAFFGSLALLENRAHERWVADGLRYLNHPLRRRHAERYVQPSLELLGRDPAHRRHLLPARLDECRARRPQLPGRGTNGHRVPRGPERLPAAPAAGHPAELGSADSGGSAPG